MDEHAPHAIRDRIDTIYRTDGRKVFATLARVLGDLDAAEEALQDALHVALERWPDEGEPDNPVAWLVSTGRFRAIDRMRKQRRTTGVEPVDLEGAMALPAADVQQRPELDDDRLRLVFMCCHPALSEQARVALTLREVCALTTEQIASAFLLNASTLAQRIVRAKAKIRDAHIPFEVPQPEELPARLDTALRVVYLVFNEGYSASSGEHVQRVDLAEEAIRLGRLLRTLLPDPEVDGLLALMLLQQSRRRARVDADGELVPLDEQDRGVWDRQRIDEGAALVEGALRTGRFGRYCLQAAIAAVHAEAPTPQDTDWPQIAGLYDALLRVEPTPVVALNRAVAVAMRDGPGAGLVLIDELCADGRLDAYHLLHAARADLLRRLGRGREAADSYRRAADLALQQPERRYLERRLRELGEHAS